MGRVARRRLWAAPPPARAEPREPSASSMGSRTRTAMLISPSLVRGLTTPATAETRSSLLPTLASPRPSPTPTPRFLMSLWRATLALMPTRASLASRPPTTAGCGGDLQRLHPHHQLRRRLVHAVGQHRPYVERCR